jgi:hypothetical protein
MKKAKRIRVKIRRAKRTALADMEKAMSLGKEVLNEMLNDGLYNSYSQNDSKIREIQDQ